MILGARLSRRETEIASLLAWGASKKEVADKLFISTRTVENTAKSIYRKTGVQKATELCVWWFCTKYGISTSLDPLKRTFIALSLLLVFIPYAILQNGAPYRRGSRAGQRIAVRAPRRRAGDDNKTFNFNTYRA